MTNETGHRNARADQLQKALQAAWESEALAPQSIHFFNGDECWLICSEGVFFLNSDLVVVRAATADEIERLRLDFKLE